MELKFAVAIAIAATWFVPAESQTGAQRGARPVTVTAIPGVVDAGAQWKIFWSGPDNADGIVGTPDGGVIFAQAEVGRVRKVDSDGKSAVVVEAPGGPGALAIDYQGRILA